MRLRPDRILTGEVRDGAAFALLKVLNTATPAGGDDLPCQLGVCLV